MMKKLLEWLSTLVFHIISFVQLFYFQRRPSIFSIAYYHSSINDQFLPLSIMPCSDPRNSSCSENEMNFVVYDQMDSESSSERKLKETSANEEVPHPIKFSFEQMLYIQKLKDFQEAKHRYEVLQRNFDDNYDKNINLKANLKGNLSELCAKKATFLRTLKELKDKEKHELLELEKLESKIITSAADQKTMQVMENRVAEKGAEITSLAEKLAMLKKELQTVKETGAQKMEIQNNQKEAFKATLKELNSTVDDLNTKLHQKEVTLVSQRKSVVAVMKAEKERLQELDLTFLQTRHDNVTKKFQSFIYYCKKEVASLYRLSCECKLSEQRNIYQSYMEITTRKIQEAEASLANVQKVYKDYIKAVRGGAMLFTLPPIDDPDLPQHRSQTASIY